MEPERLLWLRLGVGAQLLPGGNADLGGRGRKERTSLGDLFCPILEEGSRRFCHSEPEAALRRRLEFPHELFLLLTQQ